MMMIQLDYQRNNTMRDNSLGIYCVRTKKFYYLETGKVYVANTVDRLKKALIKRGLIEFTDSSFLDTDSYKILTCRDAKLEDLDVTPIYISNHVRDTVLNAEKQKSDKNNSWG